MDREDPVVEDQVPDGSWGGDMGEALGGAEEDDHISDDDNEDNQGASENRGYQNELSSDGTTSSFYAQFNSRDSILIVLVKV